MSKVVLFDMDGTLVDSEELHFDALVAAADRFGCRLPDGFGDRITGMSFADCHALLVEMTGASIPLEAISRAKHAIYVEPGARLTMRPGASVVLDRLRDAAVAFAVVSNSDRIIVDANLAAAGLRMPGLVTVARNDVRCGKPDLEPYMRAAWLLGKEPTDCIVVDDSAPGARAGLAAGMTVIAWPEPHRPDIAFPAGVVTADPADLLATLGPLLGLHSPSTSLARTA
jgi:HAD superfamily hydrolase (TIGR01509 family)